MAVLIDLPAEWDDRFPCRLPASIDGDFLRRVASAYLGEAVTGTFVRSDDAEPGIFTAPDTFTGSYVVVDVSSDAWMVAHSAAGQPGRCAAVHRLTSRSRDDETAWSLFGKLLRGALPSATLVMPLVFRRHYLKGSDPALIDAAPPEDLIYERVFLLSHKVCKDRPKQLAIRSAKAPEETTYTFTVAGQSVGAATWARATSRVTGELRDFKAAMAR
jgi:hypothetical protein